MPTVGVVDDETVTENDGDGETRVDVGTVVVVTGTSWLGVVLGEAEGVSTGGVPEVLVRGVVRLGEDRPVEVLAEPEEDGVPEVDDVPVPLRPVPFPESCVPVVLLEPVASEAVSAGGCRAEDRDAPWVVTSDVGVEGSGIVELRVESVGGSGFTGPAASAGPGEEELTAWKVTVPTASSPAIPPVAMTKDRR